jgi:hypothetical protein
MANVLIDFRSWKEIGTNLSQKRFGKRMSGRIKKHADRRRKMLHLKQKRRRNGDRKENPQIETQNELLWVLLVCPFPRRRPLGESGMTWLCKNIGVKSISQALWVQRLILGSVERELIEGDDILEHNMQSCNYGGRPSRQMLASSTGT